MWALTVVVHNNMLYGMTGGQPSGLTPEGFRTVLTPQGYPFPHHDLPRLVHDAGAPFAARVIGLGDFSGVLQQALETEGFSLVEVLEICVSYGVKMNPDLRLKELAQQAGYEPGVWTQPSRPVFRPVPRETRSLLEMEAIPARYTSSPGGRYTLVLGGSAGEGVQQAGELLAQTAIAAGLYATKKGSYPRHRGGGLFYGGGHPFPLPHFLPRRDPAWTQVALTSADGLANNRERIRKMRGGVLWLDASLPVPETGAEVRVRDFRGRAGARNAAIYALWTVLQETGVLPAEAFAETVRQSPLGRRIPEDLLAG